MKTKQRTGEDAISSNVTVILGSIEVTAQQLAEAGHLIEDLLAAGFVFARFVWWVVILRNPAAA